MGAAVVPRDRRPPAAPVSCASSSARRAICPSARWRAPALRGLRRKNEPPDRRLRRCHQQSQCSARGGLPASDTAAAGDYGGAARWLAGELLRRPSRACPQATGRPALSEDVLWWYCEFFFFVRPHMSSPTHPPIAPRATEDCGQPGAARRHVRAAERDGGGPPRMRFARRGVSLGSASGAVGARGGAVVAVITAQEKSRQWERSQSRTTRVSPGSKG
jgi:hypothetical protein